MAFRTSLSGFGAGWADRFLDLGVAGNSPCWRLEDNADDQCLVPFSDHYADVDDFQINIFNTGAVGEAVSVLAKPQTNSLTNQIIFQVF